MFWEIAIREYQNLILGFELWFSFIIWGLAPVSGLQIDETANTYRAFHRFGQAKFPNGGLVLGSSQFSIPPQPATSKNNAQFKSGQKSTQK